MAIQVGGSRFRAAVKYLMGLGTNPELTENDQRILNGMLRGPLTENEAIHALHKMGWEKTTNDQRSAARGRDG